MWLKNWRCFLFLSKYERDFTRACKHNVSFCVESFMFDSNCNVCRITIWRSHSTKYDWAVFATWDTKFVNRNLKWMQKELKWTQGTWQEGWISSHYPLRMVIKYWTSPVAETGILMAAPVSAYKGNSKIRQNSWVAFKHYYCTCVFH